MDSNLSLKGIEILESSIKVPSATASVSSFIFNIKVENKTDLEKKSIFSIVDVEILNGESNELLCTLSVSCIFQVKKVENMETNKSNNLFEIPESLTDLIIPVAISTTRGVLYTHLRGTFLHNAIIPLIDAKQFKQSESQK